MKRLAAIFLLISTPAMAQTMNQTMDKVGKAVSKIEQQLAVVGGKIALPPPQYDGVKISGQQEFIVKMPDYGVIRFMCKSENAIACTARNQRECLILLGPATHNSEDALRHERGHCAGWAADHKGGWYAN